MVVFAQKFLNVLNNMSLKTFGGGFIIGFQRAEQFAVMTLAEVLNYFIFFKFWLDKQM